MLPDHTKTEMEQIAKQQRIQYQSWPKATPNKPPPSFPADSYGTTMPWDVAGAFRSIFRFTVRVGVFIALLAAAVFATGFAAAPSTEGVDVAALTSGTFDSKHYAPTDPAVARLANVPATVLRQRYLKGAKWSWMNDSQRNALRACWLRYTHNPEAFNKISLDDQDYFLRAFDSYLLDLGRSSGQSQPLIDRGHLYLSGLDHQRDHAMALDKWREGTRYLPHDPSLEWLSSGGTASGKLFQWLWRGAYTLVMFVEDHAPFGRS